MKLKEREKEDGWKKDGIGRIREESQEGAVFI